MQDNYQISQTEKILGKYYKWWYMFSHGFKVRTQYQIDNILFALGHILTSFGVVLTWFVASQSDLNNPDFQSKVAYFVVGTILFNLINLWPSFYGYAIKNGEHTQALLRPQSFITQIWINHYGYAMYQNVVVILGVLLLSPFYYSYLNLDLNLTNLVLVTTSLIASHFILLFIELISAFAAFFITEINGLTLNLGFVQRIFSGKLFPLILLIPVFELNLLNPFSYLFYQPIQIFFGEYSTRESLIVILTGFVWSFVLYKLAKYILKLGLIKNESVGL